MGLLAAGGVRAAAGVASPPLRLAWSFLVVGVGHILSGYDHLVFLAGLILATRRVRELVVLLTAFTVAHSVSLMLVVFGDVHAPASIVEPLIAASIAWIGVENLLSRQLPRAEAGSQGPLVDSVRLRVDPRLRLRRGPDRDRVVAG